MSKQPTPDERFAICFVHLSIGWRYWAFERATGYDKEIGLNENGYASLPEAQQAVIAVVSQKAE